MHYLIVKTGALGDVVRTSYFAQALREKHGAGLRLSWFTAPASLDLLRLDPNIDDLWVKFEQARPFHFDRIFSLDDELDILQGVAGLGANSIAGAMLEDGRPTYTPDVAEWFDMGLHSHYGKQRADELKKLNQRTHAEIFSTIFGVGHVRPVFYLDPSCRRWAQDVLPGRRSLVGINPFAGGRWPSKELRPAEIERLIDALLEGSSPFGPDAEIVLIGAGQDLRKNEAFVAARRSERVKAVNTDQSVQHLAAVVGRLNYLISSDSLALHLAIAQDVPFSAFFSPTSAVEIDDWGIGTKVVSTAPDYCSYRKDADNATITAGRIMEAIDQNPRIRTLRAGAAVS
jgi:heptosyltransferase II